MLHRITNRKAGGSLPYGTGKTYYFPGGTQKIYDDPDHVVQIFKYLGWVALEDHDNDMNTDKEWVLKAIDFTYTAKNNINPCP